jgi:signal transduction histidine kinase
MIIEFLLLSAGMLNFVLGTMIIFGNKERKERILFALLSFSMAIWSLSNFLIYQVGTTFVVRISYSTGLLMIASIIGWIYYYKKEDEKKIERILPSIFIFLSFILFFISQFTGLIISGIGQTESGVLNDIKGSYFIYYLAFCLIAFAYTLISLLRLYKNGDKEIRKQLGLIVLGICFVFGFGTLFGLVMPALGVNTATDFDAPLSLIFVVFVLIAIIHYKWMNIKVFTSQIITLSIWVLLAYQFLWANTLQNQIIAGFTVFLSIVFGVMLIVSVKLEIQRKDEIEKMAGELSVANDQLHKLDRAKSEFISIASHQLRTPLTSIKGFGSLLLEGTYGVVPEAQRNALEKIYISNERLIQLVEDLLNISRIEAGRMEFDFQETHIEDLISEVVTTLELSAKAKNLYLNWQAPATAMPIVKIDITKIKEVISNMVDNSIKYTQKGGVTVKVDKNTAWDSTGKEYKNSVRVIVSDTGIGMDEEELGMIFQKFQRGKQVSHYHTDGTGLGMYIGEKIVAEHKGKIWAQSPGKDKGSIFILELPAIG